jgi:hypothetical protein
MINVSSSAHLFRKIYVDDINLRKGYGRWKSYGQSKLANVPMSTKAIGNQGKRCM